MKSIVLQQAQSLRVLETVNAVNGLLLGFGQTSPWIADLNPDPPNKYSSVQPECFGFIKVTARPVLLTDREVPGSTLTIGGYIILPVEPDLELLTKQRCRFVLIEGQLTHNDVIDGIPRSYRSIGLYKNAVFKHGTDTSSFIPVAQVERADLFYLRHSTPVTITPNAIEFIKEVVEV
jgi:hypothetical protein